MSEGFSYDDGNIFARILRGELPCRRVYEDEHVLAFEDIHPQAPVHILVIPKGAYAGFGDFAGRASEVELCALLRAVGVIARERGLEEGGYRLLVNSGADGGQEVPHVHVHILGGRNLGAMLAPSR